jgi:hypothetical protein
MNIETDPKVHDKSLGGKPPIVGTKYAPKNPVKFGPFAPPIRSNPTNVPELTTVKVGRLA